MTADPALKQPAQRAADCIAGSQRQAGGWAASSYEPPDLEITGWHVLALKSATFAGFSVPNLTWSEVTAYFDSVGSADGSYYGSRALTPIALHCRMELGWTRRHPGLNRGVERLTEDTPGVRRESIVTLYHAHNVVHHFRHREDQWTEQVRDLLVSRQDLGSIACQKGSWKPGDDWTGKKLGRLGTTALSLLILEPRVRMLSYMNPYRPGPGLMKDEAIRDAVK